MKETNFKDLKNDFDALCKTVNEDNEAVSLKLKGDREVFILPEENFNLIQKFCVTLSPQPFQK